MVKIDVSKVVRLLRLREDQTTLDVYFEDAMAGKPIPASVAGLVADRLGLPLESIVKQDASDRARPRSQRRRAAL